LLLKAVIDACRAEFGPPPRQFTWKEWFHLLMIPLNPALWMDSLLWVYFRQGTLRKNGEIVWGHIVQANNALFSKGFGDLPADVIFSFDPHYDDAIGELEGIAAALFELKGTRPEDPAAKRIAKHLTAEITRAWKLPVPVDLTGGREVFLTTIMVCRAHLPGRHLAASLFPLLATREQTKAAMILSSRYWPAELLDCWEA
jgi:hypothetical protein